MSLTVNACITARCPQMVQGGTVIRDYLRYSTSSEPSLFKFIWIPLTVINTSLESKALPLDVHDPSFSQGLGAFFSYLFMVYF